jgi:hypothetical protein
MLLTRRLFAGGLLSALAAPAIVPASSLMPVRASWHFWGEITLESWMAATGIELQQDTMLLAKARDYALARALKVTKFELTTVDATVEYKFPELSGYSTEKYLLPKTKRQLMVRLETREYNPDRIVEIPVG